tara:strand:- start:130 stop:642 length:513 start_codon:yes stop_codon:yes gene_type:complete
MSTKDWKNKEIGTLLSEAWGFKFNSLEEFNEFNGEGELQAEAEHDDDLEEGRNEDEVQEMKEEEELEEGGAAQRKGDPRVRRQDPDRLREEEELEEDKMPMKTDTEDADEDGDKTDKVPAFLDKGETKKKGKKGKQPPQLAKAQGKKPTKEQIEALVKKALQEALQNRKG